MNEYKFLTKFYIGETFHATEYLYYHQTDQEALDMLKNAANDVREMTKQWEEYKRINLGDVRRLDALTKGYPLPPDETLSSNSNLEDSALTSENAVDQPVSHPIKKRDPLKLLERLTHSKQLKGVISSRPPYINPKPNFPAYGWRFFLEKSIVTLPTDEQIDELDSTATTRSSRSLRNLDRSKSRSRQQSPAQIMQRITSPTYNTLTRATIQLKKINESNYIPKHQCERCKNRARD